MTFLLLNTSHAFLGVQCISLHCCILFWKPTPSSVYAINVWIELKVFRWYMKVPQCSSCSDVLWGIMYHYSWLFLTSILLLYVNNCLGSLRYLLVGRLTCVWSYTRTCRETIWVEGLPVSYSNISSRLYRNQVLSIYKYMYIYIIYRLHLQAGSGTQTWIVSL